MSHRGFSIPAGDFSRDDTLLKRRRSPARPPEPQPERAPPSVAMRARSKSKSRARAMSVRPGQELFALGSRRASGNSNQASFYRQATANYTPATANSGGAASSSRRPSVGRSREDSGGRRPVDEPRRPVDERRRAVDERRRPVDERRREEDERRSRRASPVSQRTRSKSTTRDRRREPSPRRRSPTPERTHSRSHRSPPRSKRARESSVSRARKRGRSKSTTRAKEATSTSESSELDAQVRDAESRLAKRKTELQDLEDELDGLRDRVKKKRYDVMDLELALDGLKKRQALARSFRTGDHTRSRSKSHRARSSSDSSDSSDSSRRASSRSRAKSRSRQSKRPCIVDDEDDEDDDDVVIIEVKQEQAAQASHSSAASSRASSKPTAVPIESPPRQPPPATTTSISTSTRAAKTSSRSANANAASNAKTDASVSSSNANTSLKEMPDNFWGRAKEGKLLVNHRFDSIQDGSARKGRHLSVNPMAQAYFATSADEGGLILWNYNHPRKEISKVVSLTPSSFRRDNACAEGVKWSPDGNRLAMAFRDPLDGTGEFCVVLLHELGLKDTNQPQDLPKSRIASMATTLHPKGISSIDWMPSGYGTQVTSTKLVTTGGSDHAVVMWDEHATGSRSNDIDFQFNVLHREHRSDIKALCIHSERNAIYTGGLDGLVIQYDLISQKTQLIMERRKPTISRINEVLEHPHNPHLLLISSLGQSDHNLLLRDLRDRAQRGTSMAAMNMTMTGQSTSQYIVPRWSPAGMHVSCGSKSGCVNIWDVRMRGSLFPNVLPQQSLRVHRTC